MLLSCLKPYACQLEQLVNLLGGDKRTRRALKLPEELSKKKKMKALRILSGKLNLRKDQINKEFSLEFIYKASPQSPTTLPDDTINPPIESILHRHAVASRLLPPPRPLPSPEEMERWKDELIAELRALANETAKRDEYIQEHKPSIATEQDHAKMAKSAGLRGGRRHNDDYYAMCRQVLASYQFLTDKECDEEEESRVPPPCRDVAKPADDDKPDTDTVVTAVLNVDMHCDSCAHRIHAFVLQIPGVEGVDMDVEKGSMTVVGRFDANKLRDRIARRTKKKKVELVAVKDNKHKCTDGESDNKEEKDNDKDKDMDMEGCNKDGKQQCKEKGALAAELQLWKTAFYISVALDQLNQLKCNPENVEDGLLLHFSCGRRPSSSIVAQFHVTFVIISWRS